MTVAKCKKWLLSPRFTPLPGRAVLSNVQCLSFCTSVWPVSRRLAHLLPGANLYALSSKWNAWSQCPDVQVLNGMNSSNVHVTLRLSQTLENSCQAVANDLKCHEQGGLGSSTLTMMPSAIITMSSDEEKGPPLALDSFP